MLPIGISSPELPGGRPSLSEIILFSLRVPVAPPVCRGGSANLRGRLPRVGSGYGQFPPNHFRLQKVP